MTAAEPATTAWSGGTRTALAGAAAGLVTGALFRAATFAGMLPDTALGGYPDTSVTATVFQLLVAALLGAPLGLLLVDRATGVGESALWGLLYGACWWFVGPLTLVPLVSRGQEVWDLPVAQAQLPSLLGLLLYGGITALWFVLTQRPLQLGISAWTPVRGLVAGLLTAAVLRVLLAAGGVHAGWLLPAGVVAGVCYPLLFQADHEGTGPSLLKGTSYGFLTWLVAAQTVPALLGGGFTAWILPRVAGTVASLPPYLLLGAGIALVATWLADLGEWLFTDDVTKLRAASPGSWGIRATGYGAAAGLVGGLVFTAVMVAAHEFGLVARIVGASTPVAGFVVHLVIAQLIGVSYAVLFRHRGFDLASGLGWGVCYGFFWWVLGNETLLPLLTGEPVRFDSAALALGFPSLAGHLAYGAALGGVYYQLEERINPWWFTRGEVEAARAERRRAELLGSAPALWGLTVVIALTMSLVISG